MDVSELPSPPEGDRGTGDYLSEDLAGAAQRALDLAPKYCDACATYHMLRPLKRYLGKASSIPDRATIDAAIGSHLVRLADARAGSIDVLIAGAADSGLLAMCANAAIHHLEEARTRVRFTVLDRCLTPLMLCRDFAGRYALDLTLEVVDLASTEAAFQADLVVLHSLFSFIPRDLHVTTLLRLAGWLTPGGRILFSTDVRSRRADEWYASRRGLRSRRIRECVEAGQFVPAEELSAFHARLEAAEAESTGHLHDFASAGEVKSLFDATGLAVLSCESTGGGARPERIVAVLAKPASGVQQRPGDPPDDLLLDPQIEDQGQHAPLGGGHG